jgi:PHD/YefM family antitoxin component YafN of YafNO toxin-antitoxin module
MLDVCLNQGPQVISRRGVDEAVLVPVDQWRRLQGDAPTLKDLLLADHARGDLLIPSRGRQRRRPAIGFD